MATINFANPFTAEAGKVLGGGDLTFG